MALLNSKEVVVAIKYGATVTTSDTIPISNEDIRIQPKAATGSFKCINGKLGNSTTWINTDDTVIDGATIEGYLTGNDATGTALATKPTWDQLYLACGLSATVVASTSVTYTPSQSQPSTATQLAVWRAGLRRTVSNVIGSLTISGTVGEPIKQTASVVGTTTLTSTSEANPSAVCTDTSLILILKSIDTFTSDAVAKKAQSFTLTQGNDNQKLYYVGGKGFERVDFASTLEVVYLKEDDAIYSDFAAGTQREIIIKAGQTNGKKVEIKCSQAVITDVTETSVNGKEAVTVRYNLMGDGTGANQFAIKYGTIA